jgi:hypothetical protein
MRSWRLASQLTEQVGTGENPRYLSSEAQQWIMERYQVRTVSKTGIVNYSNDWAGERDGPHYIVDLLRRVMTVSVETIKALKSCPCQKFCWASRLASPHEAS